MEDMKSKMNNEGVTSTATPTTSSSSSTSVCPYAAALNWNSDSDSVTTTATTNSSSINQPPDFVSEMLRTNPDATTTSPTNSTKQMIQSCPAFQNGHCPFAACTNEQEIRKMLLQIPSSHYNNNLPLSNKNSKDNEDEHHNYDDTEADEVSHEVNTRTTNSNDLTKPGTTTTPFLKILQDLHAVAGTIASNTSSSTASPSAITIPKCPVFSTTSITTTSTTNATTTTSKFTHVIMDGYSLSEIMARLAKEIEEEEDETEKDDTTLEGSNDVAVTDTSTATTGSQYDRKVTSIILESNVSISMEKQSENVPPPALVATSDDTSRSTTTKNEDRKSLSVTMKSGTAASHVAAENVYFVRNFIRGQIDPTLFAALTKQLFYVYRTLEHHLLSDQSTTEKNWVHVQSFDKYHQALQRTETLKEDLDYWFGTKEAESIIEYEFDDISSEDNENKYISPATKDYLRRIEHCAMNNPYLLLAHSYTRYLGDLSGGKILARVARKALQLSSTDGLAFYDFTSTIPNTKQFKDDYRHALDQLHPPLNHEQIQLLVAEANIAFVLNMRIFEELDVMANIPDAIVRPYEDAIRPYLVISGDSHTIETMNAHDKQTTGKVIPKECPFANMNTISNTATTATKYPSTTTATKHSHNDSSKKQHHTTSGGRCPWPFIIFHDPKQALYDWQTWMVFGLILCWIYHRLVLTVTPVA